MGQLSILLSGRLHANEKFIDSINSEVKELISTSDVTGEFETNVGKFSLNLSSSDNKQIDWDKEHKKAVTEKSPQEHIALIAKNNGRYPCNPIWLSVRSSKSDNVLYRIHEILDKSAKKQLPRDEPGLLCCFLEDIHSFHGLEKNSGLKTITEQLLSKESLRHIAAVSYCGEQLIEKSESDERFFNSGLIIYNPNCVYQEAHDYRFLSPQ